MWSTMPGDYELLYYCRQMDEQALYFLIEKYEAYMVKIAADAVAKNTFCEIYRDEFVAEALEVIYNAIWNYRENKECSFGTYFYTCASRRVKTLMRHYLRESNAANLYALSLDAIIKDDCESTYLDHFGTENDCGNPIYHLDYKEAVMRVNEVLAGFSDVDKQVLYYYLDDVTYNEAAKNLQFSLKKYDNHIQKIKRNIKEKVYK